MYVYDLVIFHWQDLINYGNTVQYSLYHSLLWAMENLHQTLWQSFEFRLFHLKPTNVKRVLLFCHIRILSSFAAQVGHAHRYECYNKQQQRTDLALQVQQWMWIGIWD